MYVCIYIYTYIYLHPRQGLIKIDMPGKYRFALTSDDASQLDIDDDIIVSNEIKPLDLAQAAQVSYLYINICIHTYIYTYIYIYQYTYI